MKKKHEPTQTEEQTRLLAEVRRDEALHTIEMISKQYHLGKYAKEGYVCTAGLVNLVQDYRRLAMAYDILGETENSEKCWKTVLRLVRERESERETYIENGNDEYIGFISKAMDEAYAALGRNNFEYFLISLELDQPEKARIYMHRRNILSEFVRELQKLENGECDILGISAPPRTGKTLLGTRYLAWVMARHKDESSFFVTHTTIMSRKVQDDILEIASMPGFKRVFPEITVDSNKEDKWIDFLPRLHNGYHTLHLASMDSAKAGVIDCSCLLYCDDLIEGIEQAMSPERMEKALDKYKVDIRQRISKSDNRTLMIATRWGTNDPLTYEDNKNINNPRAKFIKRPALNELGESNYLFTVDPFTTQFFQDIKNDMDEVSFECIYQQNPMDREGLMFTNLKRYKELPKGNPDVIYMACDVAFSGSDNLSAPMAYQFGDDVYITDAVFSPEGYTITEPLVTSFMEKHSPNFAKFEANNGGDFYAKDIRNAVEEIINTRIYSERTKSNKMFRISQFEPIIQQFYFKDRTLYKPGSMYDKFIREIERFNINGKNKHDDAVDSLAMLAEMKRKAQNGGGVFVMKRKGKSPFRSRL